MTKVNRSLWDRVLAFLLCFAVLIGFLPTNAGSVFAAEAPALGTLSGITAGGTITDANGLNPVITYSDGAVLDWSAKNPGIGRSVDGWWVGIKLTAPDTMTSQVDFDGVTYQTRNGSEWSAAKSFWLYKDSSDSADIHYIELWGVVNEESLNNAITAGTAIQYAWQFDWNADGTYEQLITLNIKPDDIVLKKGGTTVYPSATGLGSVSALSDGLAVTNDSGNFVKAAYASSAVLTWAAADPSVGRMNDGWWFGIKVSAPDTLTTEADFENVTYQRMDGGVWSAAKSFWSFKDSSDADSVHYIQLWGLLNEANLKNAEVNGKNLRYSWRFDWNKDGVYEQQISLTADPHQITLKDSDGNQVYPSLGTVTTYTGGTVSGVAGNITVTVDETTLNWSPRDPSIGRNIDAWWVGIKVTAPDYSNAVLENALYQRLDYAATEWTANKSFWSNRDSTDSDSVQYIQMWVPLTPAILSQAIEDGVNLTTKYRFDWDNDGEFEQMISLVIVPGDGIVLNKVAQTGFRFENEAPVDQWVGSTFTNTASGGQGSGAVKYEIIAGSDTAAIDENTGTVTFSAAGTITVQATREADDTYKEATAQYTVTSVRYPQTEFKFHSSNPGAIAFAENKTFENKAEGGSGSGEILYEIVSGGSVATIDSATGTVTLLKAGEITVKATKKADAFYTEATATYTLTINKGEQEALAFSTLPAGGELVYSTEAYDHAVVAGGGSGAGELSYSVVEGNAVATITPDGRITTLKSGTFTIRVEKGGDEGYLPAAAIETTITVVKAEQSTFAFTCSMPNAVTYNENGNKFVNPAVGGESEGTVTYTIASPGGEAIVDIDTDGTLTIKRAGTVTICATRDADEKYNEASATYELEIRKADQTFSFADGESVSRYYGVKTYENGIVYTDLEEKADGKGYGTGAITYTLSGDDIGASIGADGVITFSDSTVKVGEVTVKAEKAADDCYNSAAKEYTLTIAYLPAPADAYSLSGEQRNASGWFTSDVTVRAADGYKISYSNALSTSDWDDFVIYSNEGVNTTAVYLMNANGEITDAISVDAIMIDKTDPTGVDIAYSTALFDKVIESVTFGIYKAPVTVTLTAASDYSGIESFTYRIGDSDVTVNKSDFTSNIGGVATCEFTVDSQYRGVVSITAASASGRKVSVTGSKTLVVDSEKPELSVSYEFSSGASRNDGGKIFTQGATTVYFAIEEANFDISDRPSVKVDGITAAIDWTQNPETEKWESNMTISNPGSHTINVTYADISTNEMEAYEQMLVLDGAAPTLVSVTYDNTDATNGNFYKAGRKATIVLSEDNFKPEDFCLEVAATDVTGADLGLTEEYRSLLRNPANWTTTGNVHKAEVVFGRDGRYAITLNYTDLSGNAMTEWSDEFVIDTTAPTDLRISYSAPIIQKVIETLTFGFYKADVEITLSAEDITAGVDSFVWTYTQEDGTSTAKNVGTRTATIPADKIQYSAGGKSATASFTLTGTDAEQFRGSISFDVVDRSANKATMSDSNRINVVDTISPSRSVAFSAARVMDTNTLEDIDAYSENDHDHIALYYEHEATVTFAIEEANFYAEDIAIKVNGTRREPTDWTQDGDIWTGTITISGDGDYVVTVEYTDRSGNAMANYTSPSIVIDDTNPTISAAYNPADAAANEKFFNADRAMTVTVVEHNFRADDLRVKVAAEDAAGNSASGEAAQAIADYLTNRDNWTSTGDTHVATVPFTVDAQYDIVIDYSDLIGNAAVQYVAPPFVIDHAAPSELMISYSQESKFWEKALNAITFGYYAYSPTVEVTMCAFDDISGVDCFTWTYTQEDGTSTTKNVSTRTAIISADEIMYSADKKTATAKFTLTGTDAEQFRGSISFTATDRAANESEKLDDYARIHIVDTISPTRVVTYSEAKQVVDAATLQTKTTYEYAGENKNSILYYDDTVTVTIKITEANFYAEDVVIKDNDMVITPDNWNQDGDEWTASFALTEEGDHIVTMTYADRSDNTMTSYASERIVIDRTAPVIDVSYKNTDVRNTVRDAENHDRQYFDAAQVATVTITEHNFRPDDVLVRVKAKDAAGANVATFSFDAEGNVTLYASEGNSREEWAKLTPFTDVAAWRTDTDTYRLEIEYANDANYTFDIAYKDLACNEAAAYSTDYFTVDKTAPENLAVSYSTSVFENVLESVTFGYYSAQMTVTITAEDDISGIYHFLYSYAKSEGVSSVNAELIDDAIRSADIHYNGAVATATFTIPKYALGSDNQFNGTVRFTAFDRAENSTDKSDTERIIVDNIRPSIHVTYNDPVRTANGISYYAGDANVRMDIQEANFYSEDVRVTVIKDGSSYPVAVSWMNSSVDNHTGVFTLSGDGEYVVSVSYADRSGNVMEDYQSNQITIDTTRPTVKVSNIKNNTANKDEVYTFTITADDMNIDTETFKPELTALVRGESGNYTTETIPLGDLQTIEAGKTYSFTVENLDKDAAYTLVCAVRDMSGNEYVGMVLDDNRAYSSVRFSINRHGSTFAANSFTEDLVNLYYIYSVDNDIVLEEINVDPIEDYAVKLNGKTLEDGKDYTASVTSNVGEWNKRTYVINKDLFETEGEYSVVIESTDKAGTKAYSDVKNLKIAFVVDRTAPVLTVSGVEDGGRYQIDEQTVTVIPTDDGGRLYSFKAIVLDANGNAITKDGTDVSVRFELSGEDLLQYLEEHEGKITFTVPDGLENQVQLICNDCAHKADGTTNAYSYTYTKITVSMNGWLIFYANKPLFYGSIGGVVGLAALVIFLTVFLKKKKKPNGTPTAAN